MIPGKILRTTLQFSSFHLTAGRPSIQLSEDLSSLFAGKKHSYSCAVEGWPLPVVRWLKDGQKLHNDTIDQKIIIERTIKGEELVNVTLHILDVDIGDSGNYTCEAMNNITTENRSIIVSVTCKTL